jgi:uncharacterized membrane protein YdbT with pleckstrin-like domain
MENIAFKEWVPAGNLVRLLMISFSFLIIIGTILLIVFGNITTEDYYGLIFAWGVLAFVLFLFWNYRGLEIKISTNELTVKYGLFNKKSIRLTEITSCRVTKASFGRYGGIGVRYGLDGSTAYTTSFGNTVEIVPNVGRKFVFSSNNPQKICTKVKNKTD